MQERQVDVVIIGAGSAGLSAYRAAKKHTSSVLLVEGGAYGTTCARVGCMPSKLLIAAANAIHAARDVEPFGGRIDGRITVDGAAVMARVRRERDRFVAGVQASIAAFPPDDTLDGYARFEGPGTLVVDEHTRVRFASAVIASGSRPSLPEMLQAAGDRLVTSDTLFDWQLLPGAVAVIGVGPIGLELGQALSRLDVRTRLFGRGGGLGGLRDETIRDEAERIFSHSLDLDTWSEIHAVQRDGDAVTVTFSERTSGKRVSERFDYLLAATGRTPNLDGLNLEALDLETDERGVPLFDRYTLQCRSSHDDASPIFIAGDVDQASPLLHEATDEGRIAGDNAGRFPHLRTGQRRVPLHIVFSEPQIAVVGARLSTLEKRSVAIGELSFENQGRATVMRTNQGLMHLYGEYGTGVFLGAEILGPQAEHLGHLLAWACQQRLTIVQMLDLPFYHPTLEEGLRTALRDLSAKLALTPVLFDQCTECGPGA